MTKHKYQFLVTGPSRYGDGKVHKLRFSVEHHGYYVDCRGYTGGILPYHGEWAETDPGDRPHCKRCQFT